MWPLYPRLILRATFFPLDQFLTPSFWIWHMLFDKSCRYEYFSEGSDVHMYIILLSGTCLSQNLNSSLLASKPFSKKRKKKNNTQCFKNMFLFYQYFQICELLVNMLNVGGTISVFYSQTPTAAFFVTSPQTELIALGAYVNVISLMPVEKKIHSLSFSSGWPWRCCMLFCSHEYFCKRIKVFHGGDPLMGRPTLIFWH